VSTTGKWSASIVSVEELTVRDRKAVLSTLDITYLQTLRWMQDEAPIRVIRPGNSFEVRAGFAHVKPLDGNAILSVDASELPGGVVVGDRVEFGPFEAFHENRLW
jgi:hypothetical protein